MDGESKKFENEHIIYEYIDGILHVTYKSTVVSLEIAKDILAQRIKFIGSEPHVSLVKSSTLAKFSKEARDFLFTPQAYEGILASALLTRSVFQMTITNFLLKLYKLPMPARMFRDEQEALKWLRKFKENGD